MMKPETTTITVKIQVLFAEAIANADESILQEILHDQGEFNIQDDKLDTQIVNKAEYIAWILKKRKQVSNIQYCFDTCLDCMMGNPVVIFNNGTFPRSPIQNFDTRLTGLMLRIKNAQIFDIVFCYKNKYVQSLISRSPQ
jgi:hypothetical protein